MNSLRIQRTTRSRRFHLIYVLLAALALYLLALVASVWADPTHGYGTPDLGDCQNLQAPAGNKVAYYVYAEGVQIYRWTGTTWAFVAPRAILYPNAQAQGIVGTHYAGPTWESQSGSKVVGAVLQRCTPNPDAIPWLLLQAVSSEGPGIFDGVTFIQRVNTVAGKAPTEPGAVIGETAEMPYTTEYYFYKAQD